MENIMGETPVKLTWHKALDLDELPDGRVKTVSIGTETLCLTHHEGKYGALDNHCPHQGGPLGEGSIENGLLRCPWHGWDYCPHSGKPPGGYDDGVATHPVEVRDDGVFVALEEAAVRARTISDVMIETMVNWGVEWCFGMVGHSNLNIAEAIRVQENAGKLRFIGIRHEGAASFACSAYGKLTGRPASCLAIAGPGATNLLTGLWDAHVDRSPVIALTGQVSSQVLGTGNFQEVDLIGAFGQVATWSATVLSNSRSAELMNLACKHADLGRGVSHLVFPDEIAGHESDEPADTPEGRIPMMEIGAPAEAMGAAVELLRKAKRPVIVVGHGARGDMGAVTALAEQLNAPVLSTFKAKGLISDHHPLGCGVLGRSGTPIASWFMNESDLLVVLGASFSNHTGITPKKPTIQVDSDPLVLGKFHKVDVPVWGSISVCVSEFAKSMAQGNASKDQRVEVAQRWKIWRDEKGRRLLDERGLGVNSASIFASMSRQVPEDAILAVDVGNNTYSFGRYFECRSQALLMSGYLGSIGFSFPAAMGAWAATQEARSPFAGRKVVSVSGDGGFGQYMGEFNTAVKYGMGITHVLLNNSNLGKISKEQLAGHWEVWQTSLSNPSFAEYAKLCGGHGIRVETADELDDALSEALALGDTPSIVEIISDQEYI
jgi:pyruvate oxidase